MKQLALFSREPDVSRNIRTRGKRKLTSLVYPLIKQSYGKNKQRRRAGNNCAIVSRSGYIWIWSGARDQESTNHGAHFVGWKSSYITMKLLCHERAILRNLWSQTGNSSLLPAKCWPPLHVIVGDLMLSLESQRVFQNLLLFCLNHLMTTPLRNSEFFFPRILMFSSTSSRKTKFTVPLGSSH